jgi:hypothetical protein
MRNASEFSMLFITLEAGTFLCHIYMEYLITSSYFLVLLAGKPQVVIYKFELILLIGSGC